jgi:hypothetical protein
MYLRTTYWGRDCEGQERVVADPHLLPVGLLTGPNQTILKSPWMS